MLTAVAGVVDIDRVSYFELDPIFSKRRFIIAAFSSIWLIQNILVSTCVILSLLRFRT